MNNYSLFLGKRFLILAGIVAIVYLLACISIWLGQNRLVFVPTKIIKTTPEDLGLSYQEVWIPVSPNQSERLHGWWIPATSPKTGVLLYLHGNGENIGANVERAMEFHQLGLDVLLFDYRGYGQSEGKFPTETQVYQDAQAAWDYLVQQQGIPPQDIVVYGQSLGGAIAIDLAVRNPSIRRLIVESTFTSMRDMVDHQRIYAIFPADLLLTQKFNSKSKVPSLKMPILLIHGTNDPVVPAYMSQVLFDTITGSKELFLVPDADHDNVATVAGKDYQQMIQYFIQLKPNNEPHLE
ncbi:alpha/beta hydrolase [Coleofasciculus sp. F4-SAH-05]|jgi:alpha-beta hydrolase superfamily lysophospholipase|uniref:alpha/beta hydrolase n=1 Tax=Coleofasciculus TaxID=669368 RepID=UPI0032FEB39B